MTEELATREGAALPDHRYTPLSGGLTAEDVALPRLKPGDPSNKRVKTGDLPMLSIFTELDTDDPDPEVVANPEGKTEAEQRKAQYSEYVRFFVLTDPYVTYSWKDGDDFYVRPEGHPDVEAQIVQYGARGSDDRIPRRGYNYVLALPDVDTELPYKFLLKGASARAAKQLNLKLMKAAARGPANEVLFEARLKKVEKDDYVYAIWEIRQADVPDSEVETLKASVAELVGFAQNVATRDRSRSEGQGRGGSAEVEDAPSIA